MKRVKFKKENSHEIPPLFRILDVTLFSPSPLSHDRLTKDGVYEPSEENQIGLDGLRALLMTCRQMYESVGKVYYKETLDESYVRSNATTYMKSVSFVKRVIFFRVIDMTAFPNGCMRCKDVACLQCTVLWNSGYERHARLCACNTYCFNCKETAHSMVMMNIINLFAYFLTHWEGTIFKILRHSASVKYANVYSNGLPCARIRASSSLPHV